MVVGSAAVTMIVASLTAFSPSVAHAAEGSQVASCTALAAAVASTVTVQLAGDIGTVTPCGSVSIGADVVVNLDLNGHALTIVGTQGASGADGGNLGDDGGVGTPGITIPAGSSLTVSGTGTMNVTGGIGGKGGNGGNGAGGSGVFGGWGGHGSDAGGGGAGIGGGGAVTVSGGTLNLIGGGGGLGGNGGIGNPNPGGAILPDGTGGRGGEGGAAFAGGTMTVQSVALHASGGKGGVGGHRGDGGSESHGPDGTAGNDGISGDGGVGASGGALTVNGGASVLTGGDGGDGVDSGADGGAGGAGMDAVMLTASGGSLDAFGGSGGDGHPDTTIYITDTEFDGGNGGSGGVGIAGGTSNILDGAAVTVTGGTGGASLPGSGGGAGGAGGAGLGGQSTMTAAGGMLTITGGTGGTGGLGAPNAANGLPSLAGGAGGAAVGAGAVTVSGGAVEVVGGTGGTGGIGGEGVFSAPGSPGGLGGAGGAGFGEGTVTATAGTLGVAGGVGGDGGVGGSGTIFGDVGAGGGPGGSGGLGGAGVSAGTLTVLTTTVDVAAGAGGNGGAGGPSLILATNMPGPYGTPGTSGDGGSDVDRDGTLALGGAAVWTVPTGGIFDNAGVIELSGELTGTGTLQNSGTIMMNAGGSVGLDLVVTGHNYALSFGAPGGTVSPTTLQVYAATVAATGGSLPTPTGPAEGDVFAAWRAVGGALDGATVTAATDLSVDGSSLATVVGPVPVVLGAYYGQSIDFNLPASVPVGGTTTLSATGGLSGNPVTFTLTSGSTGCTLVGTTITYVDNGICVVDADQAAGGPYVAAATVERSVQVGQIAQTITFTSTVPQDATAGGSYPVLATGGTSGNPVVFTLDAISTGCSISGNTVHFTGTGTCVINADQAGNVGYLPAPRVQQSFGVDAGHQLVSGTVVDSVTGLPLGNVCVTLWNGAAQSRTTCSGVDGTYSMDGVATGTYTVSFLDAGGLHVTQWAGGAATQGGSTPLIVIADTDYRSLDASMVGVPGSISGTVHLAAENPSQQECVYLYHSGAAGTYAEQATCTNADGRYLLSGMDPGTYVVAFVDPMGVTPTIWSGGAATQANATSIIVSAGEATTGVDVSPAPLAGSIVGRVVDKNRTIGRPNICVYAYAYDTGSATLSSTATAATCSNAQGVYVLSGLPTSGASTFQLAFVDPTGYYPTSWALTYRGFGQTYTDVAPRFSPAQGLSLSEFPVTYASFPLYEGGSISGTVLDEATSLPRVGACVYVDYAQDGTYVGVGAVTDVNGHYTLGNLAPSEVAVGSVPGYRVGFYADCSEGQPPTTHWNGGASSEGAANSIEVMAGTGTSNIDASF